MDTFSSRFDQAKEQQNLEKEEILILKKLRNKKLLFLISAYGALLYVFIDAWTYMWGDYPYWGLDILIRFRVPFLSWFMVFLYLMATIFFTRYYFQSVHPLIKDIKLGRKDVILFQPGKYQAPFFAEYYLKTPFQKEPLIRIEKDFYDSIHDNSTGTINVSPFAKFVFSVQVDDKKIKFNYSNIIGDI
jgi:hypothetical protein